MNKSEIIEGLKKLDEKLEIGTQGEAKIEIDGLKFIVILDEKDPGYFRIMLPNFWKKPQTVGFQRAYGVAVEIGKEVKLAKVFFMKDVAWASIEGYCQTSGQFLEYFDRYTKILSGVRIIFPNKIASKKA